MPYEFSLRTRVTFAETDLAGIMHFANFFRYMEMTEHAFLRSLGFSVVQQFDGVEVGWPRVHADCDYRRPLRFEEEVEIRLLIREIRSKSIAYRFVFQQPNGGEVAAIGNLTVVAVAMGDDGSGMRAIRLPAALVAQLEVAPPALLAD